MQIIESSLKNGFGLVSQIKYFAKIFNLNDVKQLIQYTKINNLTLKVVGHCTNIVNPPVIENYLVAKLCNNNIKVITENKEQVIIRVDAGLEFHSLVKFCFNNNYFGLENLALIPGTVGAAPVQNIGAYGVEIGNLINKVIAYDLTLYSTVELSKQDCNFSYRNSIFKNKRFNKYLILQVEFKLNKQFKPVTNYKSLSFLNSFPNLNAKNVLHEIIKIRKNKLPNYKIKPNLGSFFINPIINKTLFSNLENKLENNFIKLNDNKFKIYAAFLIGKSGFTKGFNFGKVSIYEKHNLILVNNKDASYYELKQTYQQIQQSVYTKFKINLEIEPNLWLDKYE